MVERISISLDEETLKQVEEQLEYGDSRSAWITEAIEEKLEREAGAEGNLNPAATAD